MTELETLLRAKMYMEKLSQGIDPTTDTAVPAGDSLRNDRLARCFYYVSQVLDGVITEKSKPPRRVRSPFCAETLRLEGFDYSDVPLRISEVTKRITATSTEPNMRSIPTKAITAWLCESGLLEEHVTPWGRVFKRPTEAGRSIGIAVEECTSKDGHPYHVTRYDRKAQEFIVDNLDCVLAVWARIKEK